MNLYRALRRGTVLKALAGREPFHWVRRQPGVMEYGSKYGRWAVQTAGLSEATVVLSFGLGEDVSFEQALLQHHGCTVHGFDPTPAALRHVAQQALGPRFAAYGVALAAHDGHLQMGLPPADAADQVSASAHAHYSGPQGRLQVPCLTLASALAHCGAARVDVLKMDVEGAEYPVLAQALAQGWLQGVQQLLVEFHHFLPGLQAAQTRQAIAGLLQAGFQTAWVGRTNHEYLFTRRGPA